MYLVNLQNLQNLYRTPQHIFHIYADMTQEFQWSFAFLLCYRAQHSVQEVVQIHFWIFSVSGEI